MKYDTLKALVNAKVYENTEQRITGGDMNNVLQSAIASLGAHYQMGGLVSPADQITVGDEPVVFLATTPGTYTYFGGIVVADGEVALLVWSGSAWSKQTTDIATRSEVSQLGQDIVVNEKRIGQLSHSFERTYNLWNELWEIGTINSSDGSNFVNLQRIRTVDYIPVLPNTHYRLNCPTDCYVFCYNNNKEYINLYFQGAGIDILTRQDCHYIRFSPVADYGTEYNGDIAFYQGTEVKPYIPYLCAKDTIAREKSTKNETDIANINLFLENNIGYEKTSENYSATQYYMLQNLGIISGQAFRVKFNITGTFTRIILCANDDNTKRLIDSNLQPVENGVWYDVIAPYDINTLGCWLSLPSGSSVGISMQSENIDGGNIKNGTITEKKFSGKLDIRKKKLVFLGTNSIYRIKFKYSATENMIINFERYGVNNFLHPHYIYKESAAELTDNFTVGLTQYLYNGTDWVSPYAYCVATDYPTIENPFTVGGHHGTQGTSGFPTMSLTDISVYADGEKITDFSKILYADEIKIITKANISACNRINLETGQKETSFIETAIWTITEKNIEVCVYLQAIEALQIGAYVGLQMSEVFAQNEESVYFNDGQSKFYNNGQSHNSLPLPFNGNRMIISKDGLIDTIVVYTNRGIGVGDLSHIGNSPVMYMASFGKCYAHNVATSNPLILGVGDVAYYSGGYTFMPSFDCVGAEKAYFYKINGEKIYCVDFLSAGESMVKIPEIEYGKTIDVVKNVNCEIDQIISGNGIRVKASNAGYVEFCIK